MFVQRDPGELYLQSVNRLGASTPGAVVAKVDPITLAPIRQTPLLPTGGHTWCGAMLTHANGTLYAVNGRFVHRIAPDCQILVEQQLPRDLAHNSLLVLPDGTLLVKDITITQRGTLTLLDPDTLEIRSRLELPEPSMGRAAADAGLVTTAVYTPGVEHLFRIVYDPRSGQLALDTTWQPRYRQPDPQQGLSWDTCLAAGSVWLLDNGDTNPVRRIIGAQPVGSEPPGPLGVAWTGSQRLMRFGMHDPEDIEEQRPFTGAPGFVIAPPVFVPQYKLAIAFDTAQGQLVGLRWSGPGTLSTVWRRALRNWMQPMVFPDTGELVVDDDVGGQDQVVVLDLASGEEKGRVALGSAPSGMFLTPGWARDFYYCTVGTIARVFVR